MSATKSERLLNLVILLLVSRNYVSKQRIRESVEDYANSSNDEVAVLGLAARVWQHAGLAASTSTALLKLRAAGFDVDRDAIDRVRPTLPADDPAFDVLYRATVDRRRVRFNYRRAGETVVTERHLEPWGVITSQHRWYVVGHDRDRDEPRMFRLSRIDGPVETVGARGAFEVPPGTDLQVLAKRLSTPSPHYVEAVVRARTGRAVGLRRRARRIEEEARPGWDRIHVSLGEWRAVSELLGYADDVVVEGPEELRTEVVTRLRTLVGARA
ncbi:MAG TPA: WYL domain-containing protein [Marmoricola sp.]